jgi:hypothetical protein
MPTATTLPKITSQPGISIAEAARRVSDLGWTPTYVQQKLKYPTDYKISRAPKTTESSGHSTRGYVATCSAMFNPAGSNG